MSPRVDRHSRRFRAALITAVTLGMLIMSFSLAAFAAGHRSTGTGGRPIAAADFSPPPSNGHAAPWTLRGPEGMRIHPAVHCRSHDRLEITTFKMGPRRIQHVCRDSWFV